MIKIRLILEAERDLPKSGWKKGETCEIINNIFDQSTGIAYHSIDKGWKIVELEILEYKKLS